MSYLTTLVRADDGTVLVPVPFDPDAVWGHKTRHLIAGTVAGVPVRGDVRRIAAGHGFVLGPAWLRGRRGNLDGEVQVAIQAEGPQRADLSPDLAAALEADPLAGEAFDALAQFY